MGGPTLMELLAEAIRRKAEERGGDYSLRELDADSGVSYSFASKLLRGKRHPSQLTIAALARALDPYLSLDEALLAAGYAPATPSLLQRAREEARRRVTDAERATRRVLLEGVPPEHEPRDASQQEAK